MPTTLDSAATEIGPLNELRMPSRSGLRVCARIGGAASAVAAARPAPAPARNRRRDEADRRGPDCGMCPPSWFSTEINPVLFVCRFEVAGPVLVKAFATKSRRKLGRYQTSTPCLPHPQRQFGTDADHVYLAETNRGGSISGLLDISYARLLPPRA